jgi:hypothetical protein
MGSHPPLAKGGSRSLGSFVVSDTRIGVTFKVPIDLEAPASRKSSIFLRKIVGAMFLRVNSKCAQQVRPPPAWIRGARPLGKPFATRQD